MPDDVVATVSDEMPLTWSAVARTLTRPYPVTLPMIVLVSLVPLYIYIATLVRGRTTYTPDLPIDRLIPLQPNWALLYGALYLFLILLPVFVVCQAEHIRRTVWAYITVWSFAYACFLLYPTIAPRPDTVAGDGFAAWGLRFLYNADPPYNCFPSIHVAHSFVSALACHRVHRSLGLVALACASLVAIATLFTRQHYIADVIGGICLALMADTVWLRGYSHADIPEFDRRVAPALALCVTGIVGLGVCCFWVAYRWGLQI